jgi:YidC/Oxa1 family membrane protein insertase
VNIFELLVIQPIFNLLIGLYSLIPGGDFGVSLIVFTVIVRLALYPLVKKQLHQTKAMKKLQPELKKIKAETKGNKQLESMRMMDLYKQHGVNPFRSIMILFIQLPIFIALYQVIRIFTYQIERVGDFTYDFMEGIGPIRQLIDNPSQFNEKLFGLVDLTDTALGNGTVNLAILTIAIIAAVTQYYMSRQLMPHSESKKGFREIMSEAAEGKQADQAEMNALITSKMTKIFPFIMLFIMVGLPGALVLYYAVSNLVAVAQQTHVLKHDEDDLEELADAPLTDTKQAPAKQNKKVASKKSPNVTRITAKDTRKKRR